MEQDFSIYRTILGTRVHVTTYDEVVALVTTWALRGESRYACFANVHVAMEGVDRPTFLSKVNSADLVASDGMPLVWALKLLGARAARRIYGPDCMVRLLAAAQKHEIPVAFYGGTPETLKALVNRARLEFPSLKITYRCSPPFRALSEAEDEAVVSAIRESAARIVFVALGCPKQEQWVADHAPRLQAVLLAVGAAFDFFAGSKPQAPQWMMSMGLEWLFRLATEPCRLWLRYLKHNPRFIFLFGRQVIRGSGRHRNGS